LDASGTESQSWIDWVSINKHVKQYYLNSLISCYTLVQLNYTLERNFCQVGEAELPSSSGCKRHGKGDRVEIWLKSNVAFLQCLL